MHERENSIEQLKLKRKEEKRNNIQQQLLNARLQNRGVASLQEPDIIRRLKKQREERNVDRVVDDMSYERLLELDRHNYDSGNGFGFETLSYLNQFKFESKGQGSNICNVCTDNIEDGSNATYLKCGHLFHYECIYEWLSRKKKCAYNCELNEEDFFN